MTNKVNVQLYENGFEKSFRIDSDYVKRLKELASNKNFSLNSQIKLILEEKFDASFRDSLEQLKVYAEDRNITENMAINSIICKYLDENYREQKSISYHTNSFNWITKKTNQVNCIGGNTTFLIDFQGQEKFCRKCGNKLEIGDWIRVLVSKRSRALKDEMYCYNCYREIQPELIHKGKVDSRLYKIEKI